MAIKKGIAIAISLMLSACATDPDKMQAVDVSPTIYRSLDCDQIAQELQKVTKRASKLQASLKKKADDDAGQMAVGMILFWPALFFLEGGDGVDAAEYANLKGEKDALEQVALEKKCTNTPKVIEAKPGESVEQTNGDGAGAAAPSKEQKPTEPNTPKVIEAKPGESVEQTNGDGAGAAAPSKEQKLTELKQLNDKGLISQGAYEEQQRKILGE